VSREALAPVVFFRHLEPREEETLLAGASFDCTTGASSWKEGSSAAVASTEGAVVAFFFGFSLSLQRKQKEKTSHKLKERERVKYKYSSQQKLTSLRGRKVPHPHGK
jgi:membrane protein YqaA with SNARE-associated domain